MFTAAHAAEDLLLLLRQPTERRITAVPGYMHIAALGRYSASEIVFCAEDEGQVVFTLERPAPPFSFIIYKSQDAAPIILLGYSSHQDQTSLLSTILTIFTAIHKQSAHFQTHQTYQLYQQLYRLLRPDPLLIKSPVLLELLEHSSTIIFPANADAALAYRYEMEVRRYFSNVLQLWTLEASNLLSFTQGPHIYDGNNNVVKCAYTSLEYSVFIPQIKSFIDSMRRHIKITGFSYGDCFNLTILEKIAQTESVFSFILTASQKHSHLLSIKRYVDQALEDKDSVLHKMILILAKSNSNAIGEFNRLSYFSQKQAGALKAALQLALSLLPYVMLIHRVSTSYYHIVYSDIHEQLSLDLLGDAFFTAISNKIRESKDPIAYDLIAYSLGSDLTLAFQHAIGPDHLFVTDILLYRRNLTSTLRFLNRLKTALPESPKLTNRISQLMLRCQDLLDLSMWQYQYSTALNIIRTGIYDFPPSLLTVLEEIVKTIQLFIPDLYATTEAEHTSNFTYALTLLPIEEAFDWLPLLTQTLASAQVLSAWPKNLVNSSIINRLSSSSASYPICGRYRPIGVTEHLPQITSKPTIQGRGSTPANRSTSGRKRPVLKLALDMDDLQASNAADSSLFSNSFSRVIDTSTKSNATTKEKRLFKYNRPKKKYVIKTLTLAILFRHNFQVMQKIIHKADFSCTHSISVGLQSLFPDLLPALKEDSNTQLVEVPVLPLRLGRHIISVRTLLERQEIFAATFPLLRQFILASNNFLLYIKHTILKTSFNITHLEQYYSCVLFIEHHYKHCIVLGYMLCCFGTVLLRLVTWKADDSPLLSTVTEEFIGTVTGHKLLDMISYLSSYILETSSISPLVNTHYRLGDYAYKHITLLGQKLPCPELLTFLWLFDQVFIALKTMRADCYCAWSSALNQVAEELQSTMESVPLSVVSQDNNLICYSIKSITPLPEFIRSCHLYQTSMVSQVFLDFEKDAESYPFYLLCDFLTHKYSQQDSFQIALLNFKDDLLNHGSTEKTRAWMLPPVSPLLSQDSLSLFQFCVSTSILHKYKRLDSLLTEHSLLSLRLHRSHLWTLAKESYTQVDTLVTRYLSDPAFTWKATDAIECFLQDLSLSIQSLSSHTNMLSTITTNLRNSLMSYVPALEKRIRLPTMQPFAPVSEFLASSRSWSNDRLPDIIVVQIINDVLSQEVGAGDAPKYFLPSLTGTIQYHDYLSFGSMILTEACLCKDSTGDDGSNQQISLFVNVCNTIEERIYLFRKSIEHQLDSYCKELELLHASTDLSMDLLLTFLNDLSLVLHELAIVWLLYLYLLCSPKTPPVLRVVTMLVEDSLHTSPTLGSLSDVPHAITALLLLLSTYKTTANQSIAPELQNTYEWAKNLICADSLLLQTCDHIEGGDFMAIFQTVTGRLAVWVVGILQIPLLISRMLERFPEIISAFQKSCNDTAKSARFDHEYSVLKQYIPLHLLFSDTSITYYYKFDGLLFYIARLLFLCHSKGYEQFTGLTTTLSASHTQLSKLKQSEDIVLMNPNAYQGNSLFLENLLDYLNDLLRIQNSIGHIPSTKQFNRFFAEFLRFKTFITEKESQLNTITCGLYLLRSTGLSEPLISQASTIVKDLAFPILSNLHFILNLYLEALVRVEKECYTHLKHAMGQIDDSRSLIIEHRYYPIIPSTLEPAALIRTVHLLRSIFKVDALKKLYEQINNKSQVLILYMQKNGIDIESTFKKATERIIALQGTINITYEKVKYLVDSTRASLLAYTVSANGMLLASLHDCLNYITLDQRESLDLTMQFAIKQRALTGSDIRKLYVHGSQILLFLEDLLVRIRHIYSRLCYHYELCYLQGIYGSDVFIKTAQDMLDFIKQSIEGTEFPSYLQLITSYQLIWGRICQVTDRLLRYEDKPLTAFYKNYSEIIALIKDSYTLRKKTILDNAAFTEFLTWYENLLHTIQEQLLSIIQLQDFTLEQWQDLIYHIGHVTQDPKCTALCNLRSEAQLTFGDVLFLKLNTHPGIMRGKISMALVNSVIVTKVAEVISHWSEINGIDFLLLVRELFSMMEDTNLSPYLFVDFIAENREPLLCLEQYFDAHDLVAISIIQQSTEERMRKMLSSASSTVSQIPLLLGHLDTLKAVAGMECSERSFPMLTSCQIYLRTILDMGFVSAALASGFSQLYNFLMAYSYVEYGQSPDSFTIWTREGKVSDCLNMLFHSLSIYKHILKFYDKNLQFKAYLSSNTVEDDSSLVEHLEIVLDFLQRHDLTQRNNKGLSVKKFNLFCTHITSYLASLKLHSFSVTLYQARDSSVAEDLDTDFSTELFTTHSAELCPKHISLYPVTILLLAALKTIARLIIESAKNYLPAISIEQVSELLYVTHYALEKIEKTVTPHNMFQLFSRGLDVCVTANTALSFSKIDLLLNGLASETLYFSNPNHTSFLQALSEANKLEFVPSVPSTHTADCSLFTTALLSSYYNTFLERLLAGYQGLILSSEHQGVVLGYLCNFPDRSPFIFYHPVNLCAINTCILTPDYCNLHPLWLVATSIFHAYEETLRVGSLLALRELRALCSLSLSVDLCTNPSTNDDNHATDIYLIYGCCDTDMHRYEFVPFQAMYIGVRLFLCALCLFQHDYTGRGAITSSTSNDFLVCICTVLQEHASMVNDLPLQLLAVQTEDDCETHIFTRLTDLPSMQWKSSMLWMMLEDFCEKLTASEKAFQLLKDRALGGGKGSLDPDLISKNLLHKLVSENVLFLQMEFSIFSTRAASILSSFDLSFSPSKVASRDTMYLVSSSPNGASITRVLFAQIASSMSKLPMTDSLRIYSPTLSLTRSYLNSLLDAVSCQSMLSYGLQLVSSVRSIFQATLFPDNSQEHERRSIQLFANRYAWQIIVEIASVICFSTSKQTGSPALLSYDYESANSRYLLLLAPIDSSWATSQWQGHAVSGLEHAFSTEGSKIQVPSQSRMYNACTEIANLIKDPSNGKVTCKSLERTLCKFLYHLFAGSNIEQAEQPLYLSIDELLRNMEPLSLYGSGQVAENIIPFDSRTFLLHAQSILQQMVSTDLDERLLQCMDPLIDWLLQLLMRLRYLFIASRSVNIAVLSGPVFSYVHILPWIFYRVLLSLVYPVCYCSDHSDQLAREHQQSEHLTIYSHNLLANQSIEDIISHTAIDQLWHRTILMLTTEDLTAEQRSVCHRHGLPVLNTVRPIADANDFKHLELLSLYTNLHAWCHPAYPRINGTWHFKPPRSPLGSTDIDIETSSEPRVEPEQPQQQKLRSIEGPLENLHNMHMSLAHQRKILAPRIAHSFIELSGVYRDLVDKTVSSNELCSYYRYHAITSALSIVLAILDALLVDTCIRANILKLETKYFHAIVIFSCSWAYASLPISSHRGTGLASGCISVPHDQPRSSLYIDLSIPKSSPLLLKTAPPTLHAKQTTLDSAQISWPVFLSNALGSLVLTKIGCFASNIYDFVPAIRVESRVATDAMLTVSLTLEHRSWPDLGQIPSTLVPQIVVMLCQLYSGERLLSAGTTLSDIEFSILGTYVSHIYSLGVRGLPMQRCLDFLINIFVLSDSRPTNGLLTHAISSEHRLTPLQIMHCVTYPFSYGQVSKNRATTTCQWISSAEFCPLIISTIPIFSTPSLQQYSVHSYAKISNQTLYIFNHYRPGHHIQELYRSKSIVLLQDTYNTSERIDSHFAFMIPRINSAVHALVFQLFQPLVSNLPISCDQNIYTVLIQLTLQAIQDYRGYMGNQHTLNIMLAILAPIQSLLEGFALNEQITRSVYYSLTHEDLASVHEPILTPRLAIFAWLLSTVDFYTSCFSKSLYDDTQTINFGELKEFCGSLLSLASFKANRFVDEDSGGSTSLNNSIKSFGTLELLEFYKACPLFALCLGHNNLFLPLRLRNISSFPIRTGSNTMSGVLSSFAVQHQKLDEVIMYPTPLQDASMFLRLLGLQEYQDFILANNTSLPLPCPITKSSEQTGSSPPSGIGIICTRTVQCINFKVLCDLVLNAHMILHSSHLDPLDGNYMYYSHISMPAFRVGILLHHLSLLPMSRVEGISSVLANHHLRTSRFILTEPGHSLRDTLAYACNLRGLTYPLEVTGTQNTEDGLMLELAKTLSLGYMLAAWMRKPVCIYISSYVVQSDKILSALTSLLCYGYSPEIMGMLTAIEQYTLARKILSLLYDRSYSSEAVDNAIFKDFSSIADGPLERIGTLQIPDSESPSLVKAIRSSGLRRFLHLAALAHFSIPPSSSRGRDPAQSYTLQLKLRRSGNPPITALNTLPELLCSPIDVLATGSTDISLSSLLSVYVDVPIYSDIHALLKMAHYTHIYTSNLVSAMPPIAELGLVEDTLYRELSTSVPLILQDVLDDRECLKLAKVYIYILNYLSKAVDKRLLFYYTSYSTCVEFGKVLKSLLYHRKHTFTVRQEHYDLALKNLQLVHENSEQALESCRRVSAEIQAHSLAFQNTNFELSHLEEEILMVKQRLCVRNNDKKYAEEMLKKAIELQNQYKKQIVVFHKQMDRISDYQNSVNPILFAASWQTHKHFQECLSMACLHLAACASKKVSVFALAVPKKDASKHISKDKELTLDTFKRRVSNIDVFIKEMIAPSPEEIVNSSHYQAITNYLLDAIESISGYRHTSPTYLVPTEHVKVEKEPHGGSAVLPKEISKLLPPFYAKEKARYVPSTMDLLNASVKVRGIHVIADMLLWILLFQMELSSMWVSGAEHRQVISDQTSIISSCISDIDSLERQLAALESRLLLGQERKQNLSTELTTLRTRYAESKDMLSTTSSILSSISDLRQAWLGTSADLKLKLDNVLGDSIVIATAYTMLLHINSAVRCRHLASIANILADLYGYTISPVWTEKGLSDSCVTKMTLSSNELMQIQYAALTSHFFASQAPLYERDLNIILSNTSVEVSGDINVSEDEWLGLINCFGSLTEIEADILRHGSTLIHETFVFYVTALLFGHRNTAVLVTEQTKYQGKLLLEIASKVSIFHTSSNGCTRPVFLQTLADCQRVYSTVQHYVLDSTSELTCQARTREEAIASISGSLHADAITSEDPLETLRAASVVLPIAVDIASMPHTSIQDLILGAFQVSSSEGGDAYNYVINRQSSCLETLYSKPDTLTVHNPMRLFLTAPCDKQDIVLSIANNQLLSFCSLIDLEPIGYRSHNIPASTPAVKVILQQPMSDFTYLNYTGNLTAVEKPVVSTYRVDSERIYQEVSLCGYVLSDIDEAIVDLMCTLQSNADTLNTLTNKMLQLVLSPDKVPFLEAIAEVHQQMKIVTAMVIRLKKCLFLKIHINRR